jgi:hypothetical protein
MRKEKYASGKIGKRQPTVGEQPPDSHLRSIGCINTTAGDYIRFKIDISKEDELYFLVDTGADVSIISSKKLIGTTEFEPRQKVRLKSFDGSIVETHGLVSANIQEGKAKIPFKFQLVNKQVDLEGDGIIGKDFLQKMKAQICYESRRVKFQWKNLSFNKGLTSERPSGKNSQEVRNLTLPKRSETIVQIPVDCEENQAEGLIEKYEINKGVFVASSLTTVKNGYVITSVLNTNEHDVVIPEPKVKLVKFEAMPAREKTVNSTSKY